MIKIKSKKGYKITDKFTIAPYSNHMVQLLIMEDREEATLKALNKAIPDMEFTRDTYAVVQPYYKDMKNILIVFNVAFQPLYVDTIAHEATHVKNIIFDTIGHEPKTTYGQDEPEAYLMGYLTHIIFDFFKRTNNLDKIEFTYKETHY